MKNEYTRYTQDINLPGSGRANSYIRALDLLAAMIETAPLGFEDCQDIWNVTSHNRLEQLYHFTIEQQHLGKDSQWHLPNLPKSYLRDGYCSAAIRDFQSFLAEYTNEQRLINEFESHNGSEDELVAKLKKPFELPDQLLKQLSEQEGKDAIRTVKARVNQRAFKRILISIYEGTCCITGLNIPEINRASHIIPWSTRKETRMDPRNGLYLSATYDSAFDRNLISLDDHYRLILSKDLKDNYTNDAYKNHFEKKEGQRISLPKTYLPALEYLEHHRGKGRF